MAVTGEHCTVFCSSKGKKEAGKKEGVSIIAAAGATPASIEFVLATSLCRSLHRSGSEEENANF